MTHYKHFSFDLWMTLIKSNPSFKKLRAGYFFAHHNPLQKKIEEVEQVFRHVDLMCNAINEKTGKNIDAEEMYGMVIYQLAHSVEAVQEADMSKLYIEMEHLVLENMPVLYSAETKDVLDKIKGEKGNTMSILSNTAFIKGTTLRKVLLQLQIGNYFDFQLYSDEVGVSKPNCKIYETMFEQVTLARYEAIQLKDVVHIGDNTIADIAAADAFGIGSFQINTNNQLITDLLS